MGKVFKFLGKLLLIFGGIYAVLFAVFFFDLDGKLLFRVVEPFLVKHYDKMPRRDPLSKKYDTDTPSYEYKV